jgi:hypothetical protein
MRYVLHSAWDFVLVLVIGGKHALGSAGPKLAVLPEQSGELTTRIALVDLPLELAIELEIPASAKGA